MGLVMPGITIAAEKTQETCDFPLFPPKKKEVFSKWTETLKRWSYEVWFDQNDCSLFSNSKNKKKKTCLSSSNECNVIGSCRGAKDLNFHVWHTGQAGRARPKIRGTVTIDFHTKVGHKPKLMSEECDRREITGYQKSHVRHSENLSRSLDLRIMRLFL